MAHGLWRTGVWGGVSLGPMSGALLAALTWGSLPPTDMALALRWAGILGFARPPSPSSSPSPQSRTKMAWTGRGSTHTTHIHTQNKKMF